MSVLRYLAACCEEVHFIQKNYTRMKIGNRIKKIREFKNYTQEYMAGQLGISQRAYSKIENDEVSISIEKLFLFLIF
jgi:DNA-binding XRE family transcriptional regulator